MLFLTPDNAFAGPDQAISLEYLEEVKASMG